MVKLFLALLLTCLLVGSDGVTVKRLKSKTKNLKVHLKRDNMPANRTYFELGSAKLKVLQKTMKVPSNEICAIICDPKCIEYVCEDGVCCTPGSPTSLCCPYDHPLCVTDGCCPEGYPKKCGQYCCEKDSMCCLNGCCEAGEFCCGTGCCDVTDVCCLDHCCDLGNLCCGTGCCELGKTCCNGLNCCEQKETCCGSNCCKENQTCCTVKGQKQCCNKTEIVNACSSDLHFSPCPYQFDVLQCTEKLYWKKDLLIKATTTTCPVISETRVLYRVLRPDETCYDGLKAKEPHAHETVHSFVNCGSKEGYTSQYISTTSSLGVAMSYKLALPSVEIAQIDVNEDLLATCNIVDLVDRIEREKHLGDATSGKFAADSCEYLLTCKTRIPCKEL